MVVPGHAHHITHRGNRRAEVFVTKADRDLYKAILTDYGARAGLEVWAYCLMSNHVHLLVVPRREDSLAKGVGLAHRHYAVTLNRRECWDGHFWANRFFSTPLDEQHLWTAARYIEQNPVRAGMVKAAWDYPWSSARSHVEGVGDTLLWPQRPFPGPVGDWAQWLDSDIGETRRHSSASADAPRQAALAAAMDSSTLLKRISGEFCVPSPPDGRKKPTDSQPNKPTCSQRKNEYPVPALLH